MSLGAAFVKKEESVPKDEDNVNEQEIIDVPKDGNVSSLPVMTIVLIPVSFKEAAMDSPSFRASMNHLNEQYEALDRWIRTFTKALTRLSHEMDSVQDAANLLISRFVPGFVTQGIIDHDYTMLAMRRYAEATRYYWANTIRKIKTQNSRTTEPLIVFQKSHVKAYKETYKNFEAAQARFDAAHAKYSASPKTKEPSAIREDAFQLSEARKTYTKASFDLCIIATQLYREANVVLITTLTNPWLLRSRSVSISDPIYHQIGLDMHRIQSWLRTMEATVRPIEVEMLKIRKEMESQAILRSQPSRDLKDYSAQTSTIQHFALDEKKTLIEKHGWLYIKSYGKPTRTIWIRRWCFVQDGVFGWFTVSAKGTSVQESDKIGVLLCNIATDPNEERRFCFEIRTKSSSMVLQCETLSELRSWLEVFEAAKRTILNSDKSQHDIVQYIKSPISDFSSSGSSSLELETPTISHERTSSGSGAASFLPAAVTGIPDSPTTSQPGHSLDALMERGRNLLTSSIFESSFQTSRSQFSSLGLAYGMLAPSPLVNIPMPTSLTQDAVVAHSILPPTSIPNAVSANYWGTINWGAVHIKSMAIKDKNEAFLNSLKRASSSSALGSNGIPKIAPQQFPDYYPSVLRSQQTQLRALFEMLVDDDPYDMVVIGFRAIARMNSKHELPGRAFITPKYMYVYMYSCGFVSINRVPLNVFVSVEEHSSISYDSLHLINESGSSVSLKIFLESGKTLQKRLQFLIDNSNSDEPLPLENIITELEKIGVNRKNKFKENLELPEGAEFEGGYDSQDALEPLKISTADTGSAAPGSPLSPSSGRNIIDGTGDNDDVFGTTMKGLLSRYLTSQKPKPTETSRQSPVTDLSGIMSHRILEKVFDISPKALFHLLFGEQSPVFTFTETSLYKRDNLKVTPWRITESGRLEREFVFQLVSTGVLLNSREVTRQDRVFSIQRVENRDEHTHYVVYERRTPWDLPHGGGSFFVDCRYVVEHYGKAKSKLVIWGNVEWVKKTSLVSTVVESMIYRNLDAEARMVVGRAVACRKRLGNRGMAVTAIKLFGKLGTKRGSEVGPGEADKEATKAAVSSDSLASSISTPFSNVRISERVFFLTLLRIGFSWLLSLIIAIFKFVAMAVRHVWHELTIQRGVLLFAIVSSLANIWLMGMTSVSYWTERSAQKVLDGLHVVPDASSTFMRRSLYLSDINDAINTGHGFHARSKDDDSLCYNKFKSIIYDPIIDGTSNDDTADIGSAGWVDLSKTASLDRHSIELSHKIRQLRNDIGARRNQLLLNLRILNRMEYETLVTEWRNWLRRELTMCNVLNGGDTTSPVAEFVKHNDTYKAGIEGYCRACELEWVESDFDSLGFGELNAHKL